MEKGEVEQKGMVVRGKGSRRKISRKILVVDSLGAVGGGVAEGGDGEVLGGAIRGVMSVPAASLSIFSHYPPRALTRDFYKGCFKSSNESNLMCSYWNKGLSSDFLSRIFSIMAI